MRSFFAWVLAASVSGMKARYARLLSWAPLVYLGKISYGIYVYHVFIIILVSPLLVPYGLSEEPQRIRAASQMLLALTLVTVVALLALAGAAVHGVEEIHRVGTEAESRPPSPPANARHPLRAPALLGRLFYIS